MLQDHGVNGNRGIAVQRPLEDLLRKLKELRSLRVTFLRVADDWAAQQHFREMERDSWNKTVDETLKRLGETWLIGSQWAGR
jgi:hypothetical protein